MMRWYQTIRLDAACSCSCVLAMVYGFCSHGCSTIITPQVTFEWRIPFYA